MSSKTLYRLLAVVTFIVLAFCFIRPAQAQYSFQFPNPEVLVSNASATQLPSTSGRHSVEILNNGPNTIYCAFNSTYAVVNKARPIRSGDSWSLDAPSTVKIYCIAATAVQVTGAATIVTEM